MQQYKQCVLLAEGESFRNGAPVPFGTKAYIVSDQYKLPEFSCNYQSEIDCLRKWALEGESILLYSSEGGFFLRARKEILQAICIN